MIANNIILGKKHLYMQILVDIETIRKQKELDAISSENFGSSDSNSVNEIWVNAFAGLIREGLDYEYIITSDENLIRLTIDGIQFDCKEKDLKKVMPDDYDMFIDENHNLIFMNDDITLVSELEDPFHKKTQKEKELEEEISKLKEKAMEQQKQYLREICHDPVTGLKNERGLKEDLKNLTGNLYFISIGLSDFNKIYDNEELIAIAKNISTIFDEYSYRIGKNEFFAIYSENDESRLRDKLNELEDKLISCVNSESTDLINVGYMLCDLNVSDDDFLKDNYIREVEALMLEKRFEKLCKSIDGSDEVIDESNTVLTTEKNQEPLRHVINEVKDSNNILKPVETVEDNDENLDKFYNNSFDKYKDMSTFVYDTYEATILAPGSSRGESFKALIAPLKMYTDNNHPEIMCMLINSFGEIRRYVSTELSPTLKVQFGDYELIIRGIFTDGKFTSKILASGSTLAMGFSININTYVPQRSNNLELTNYGHLVFKQDDYVFHVVPMSKTNNNSGIAPCFICIETPEGERNLISTNENAVTLYEKDNVTMQILTYWQDNILCAEII